MSVWAAYVKRSADSPWRLEALSVLGADRARALAEREHARNRIMGAEYRVQRFETMNEVPDCLQG